MNEFDYITGSQVAPLDRESVTRGTRPLTAFNARTMSVHQIVDSFVVHDAFYRLAHPVNTLLSGPRGSGKTTMMKMLQPAALEIWDHPRAQAFRESIPYSGVFIMTDRAWKRQLAPRIGKDNPFQPELALTANAAFTMHTLRELVLAMKGRANRLGLWQGSANAGTIAERAESQVARSIARVAHLEELVPSFDGLADGLSVRLAELQALRNAFRDFRNFPIPAWAAIDAIAAVESSIEIFNRAIGDVGHQWALLFDEMELAPPEITTALLEAMRGQSSDILLKLSLSPVQPELAVLSLPLSGIHGQDFEFVQLNHPNQRTSVTFGSEMLRATAERRGEVITSPSRLLGHSVFSREDEGSGGDDFAEAALASGRKSPYAHGGPLWKRFDALRRSDPTFRDWLNRKAVNLDVLELLNGNERAASLRKVRNLVVVREYYRREQSSRRSRKTYELYHGMDSIVAICDGNPRMLTALIGQLLGSRNNTIRTRIPGSVQSAAIDGIVRRFFALVDGTEAITVGNTFITLRQVVDTIGSELARLVVTEPFTDNVPLSFFVDAHIPASIRQVIQLGVNAGAFVFIPSKEDSQIPLNLEDAQFRLSYALAPYYGLPIRMGRSVSLSRLLRPDRRGRKQQSGVEQGSLFDVVAMRSTEWR